MALIACKPADQGDSASTPAATTTPPATAAKTHKPATTATNWQCGDLSVATRFDDESLESMTLTQSGQELTLKTVETDEGARFADAAGNEFWSRPGKVSVTLAGKPMTDCKKSR
ncbi:MAG TPA: MliC family protein [Lysobacter sp.]|nr:MliC family protein [Lysobacter sp.]